MKREKFMNKCVKRIISVAMVIVFGMSLSACGAANPDKKALLIVSFGSSFIENRANSIDASEEVIKEAFPEYDSYTAFTSQIIIDVYKDRDGIEYDDVTGAMEKIVKEKYGEILVVPTHVINGEEYDQMIDAIRPFEESVETLTISSPLLTHIDDYDSVTDAIITELPEVDDQTAIVLMGHGTHHSANSAYPMLDYVFKHKGHDNIYVGTVEGSPEFDNVVEDLEGKGYEKILLMPLMIVAGDHAHNDMAGDEEDSWKVMFKSLGYEVDYIMKGMGELPAIQNLFVEHAQLALEQKEN